MFINVIIPPPFPAERAPGQFHSSACRHFQLDDAPMSFKYCRPVRVGKHTKLDPWAAKVQ